MTAARCLLTALALLASTAVSAPVPAQPTGSNGRAGALLYVLEPTLHETTCQFHVALTFQGRASGADQLVLPQQSGDQERLYRAIHNLRALSGDTVLQDTPDPHLKTITYRPGQNVQVAYDVVQDWPGTQIAGDIYRRVVLQRDYFQCLGEAFWVYPAGGSARPRPVTLVWKSVPPGWTLCNSFGVNRFRQTLRISTDELRDGIYAGGDFRVLFALVRGKPLSVALRGREWKFTDDALTRTVQSIVQIERDFWHDHHMRYLLVTLLPTENEEGGFSGQGMTNGFALWLPKTTGLSYFVKRNLAHEMFHAWNPGQMGVLDLPRWFVEGFTDYYADLFILRAGLGTLDEYVLEYNARLRTYYTSIVRNLTGEQAARERYSSYFGFLLDYERGWLLANNWNAAIRKRCDGRRSLDDAMHDLRRRAGQKRGLAGDAAVIAALQPYLGEQAWEDIQRYLVNGLTIPPRADALGPCVEQAAIERFLFDPGFDLESMASQKVIRGVRRGSNADLAGLRDGQTVLDSRPISVGYAYEPVEMRVKGIDGEKTVRFYPQGEKIRVPQYRVKPTLTYAERRNGLLWFESRLRSRLKSSAGSEP